VEVSKGRLDGMSTGNGKDAFEFNGKDAGRLYLAFSESNVAPGPDATVVTVAFRRGLSVSCCGMYAKSIRSFSPIMARR
jgi:hypothetical protein